MVGNIEDLSPRPSSNELLAFNKLDLKVVAKYNAMLVMLADEIPSDDDDSWGSATHALWDAVGSDESLPDYTKEQMLAAVKKAA